MERDVTPELKDKILSTIKVHPRRYSMQVDCKHFSISKDMLNSLLRSFAKRGFITILQTFNGTGDMIIRVEIETDDFLRSGGYIFEEEIINSELKKLELEIRKLQSDIPNDRYNTILQTFGTIFGAWSAFHSK
jgi:hypothetical protein